MADLTSTLIQLEAIRCGEDSDQLTNFPGEVLSELAEQAVALLNGRAAAAPVENGAVWESPHNLILRVMISQGHSPKDISTALPNRTVVSVKRRARKLQLTFMRVKRNPKEPKLEYTPTRVPFKPTADDEKLVRQMAAENKTTDEIKIALGIGYCTLMRYIKQLNAAVTVEDQRIKVNRRYGYSDPLPDLTKSDDDRIWKLWQEGHTIEQISDVLKRSRATVEDRLRFLRTGKKRRGTRKDSTVESPQAHRRQQSKQPLECFQAQ